MKKLIKIIIIILLFKSTPSYSVDFITVPHAQKEIESSPTNEEYALYKDSSYVNSTVLSDIWPQPNFNSYDWGEKHGQTDTYLGKKWYLAINLRRLNPSSDLIKDNNIVLKLKMPFKSLHQLKGATGTLGAMNIYNLISEIEKNRENPEKLEIYRKDFNFKHKKFLELIMKLEHIS